MDDPSPRYETLKEMILTAIENCDDADLLDFICVLLEYSM